MANTFDLLDEIVADLSAEGQQQAERMNDEIKVMRNGIREKLWMAYKELRNDYDKYSLVWGKIAAALRDGYLDGLYDDNGQPIPRWKPAREQHDILSAVMQKFGLTIEECRKLAARGEERYSRRATQSGTYAERQSFEPAKASKPYAKRDNDLAIEEQDAKRELARVQNAQRKLHIAN